MKRLTVYFREGEQNEMLTPFMLHPWLRDEEREMECLRQVTEALLLVLLPPAYARCDSHRHLLREIISSSGTANIFILSFLNSILTK